MNKDLGQQRPEIDDPLCDHPAAEKTLGQIAAFAYDEAMDRCVGRNPMHAREVAWEAAASAVRNAVIEEIARRADVQACVKRLDAYYEAAGALEDFGEEVRNLK